MSIAVKVLKIYRFHDVGKLLLSYLERFWEYALKEPCPTLPPRARESLAEASLAASRLIGVSPSNYVVAVAAKMQKAGLPEYLQLAIVNRQSVMFSVRREHNRTNGTTGTVTRYRVTSLY
jgi:hypothetical protein